MNDHLVYAGFVIIFLVTVAVMMYMHYHGRKESDYLDFFFVFTGSFGLYTLSGTFYWVSNNAQSINTSLVVYLSTIIGYISFASGYIYISKRYRSLYFGGRGKIRFTFLDLPVSMKQRLSDFLFLCFFFFFILLNISKVKDMIFGFGTGASYVDYSLRPERTALTGPIALLSSFFDLFFMGLPFLRIYKSGKIRFLDMFMLIILGTYLLSSGNRSALLPMGFLILSLYNYKIRRITLSHLCVLGFVLMILFILIGNLRFVNSVSGMIDLMVNSRDSLGVSPMIVVTRSGEFYYTLGTFYTNVHAIHTGNHSFNFGYTWFIDILVYIPTLLFPNRPLPWNEQHMLDFYPYAASGSGYGWYVLNDGYMSFGILGIALEMFLIGVFLAKLYYFLRKRMNSEYIGLMYSMILSSVFMLTRASFLESIKTCFLSICPLIFIYNIENLCKGKIAWKTDNTKGTVRSSL